MTDIPALINSLLPEELAVLRQRGPAQLLDRTMVDALDRAAGEPGEGRGYYIVRGSLEPKEHRRYYLREDVAAAVFAPVTFEGASRADI